MDTTLQQVSDAVGKISAIDNLISGMLSDIVEINEKIDNLTKYVESMNQPDVPEEPEEPDEVVLVCPNDESVITNDKLDSAMKEAASRGVPVRVSKGNYLIKPGVKIIASLIGEGSYFITKESSLYNTMFQTVGSGLRISGLFFDQMRDAGMLPDSKMYKGLHILHVPDGNDITIDNCSFLGCGVTSILTNPFDGYGKNLKITNNQFQWKRKINSYFDVSIINADGIDIDVSNNLIMVERWSGVDDWRAESGIEFHCCSGVVKNNTISNCINGLLHVGYPSLYKNYNVDLMGKTEIYDNYINQVCRGIVSWGRLSGLPIVNKDIDIYNNSINLHLDRRGMSYYYPNVGIGLVNGGVDDSIFDAIRIADNSIKTTCEQGLNEKSILNYGPIASELGGIYLMTKNDCINVDIVNNQINFPFAATQIRALGNRLHQKILIDGNVFEGCAIYRGYLSGGFDGIYNFENVDGVLAKNNIIIGSPLKIRTDGRNVKNVSII